MNRVAKFHQIRAGPVDGVHHPIVTSKVTGMPLWITSKIEWGLALWLGIAKVK